MRRKRLLGIIFIGVLAGIFVIGGGAVARAAGPNISGHWWGNNGVEYDITQMGTTFQWHVPQNGQVGGGNISGNSCSAAWPFGFATGNIITDPSGWAVEIDWSNGVIFNRGGFPGGGGPPGGGGQPGGGGVNFSFGPNPARPGCEVWLNLTSPVAHQIQVYLNGVHLPIVNFKGDSFVTVKLPMNVTSGPLEIDYQGRRIRSNQPKNTLEIISADISGNWSNKSNGFNYVLNQNNNTYSVYCSNPGPAFPPGSNTGNGQLYGGNQLNVHWGAKPPSMNLNDVGTIGDLDPNGRAHRIQWNSGDLWTRP